MERQDHSSYMTLHLVGGVPQQMEHRLRKLVIHCQTQGIKPSTFGNYTMIFEENGETLYGKIDVEYDVASCNYVFTLRVNDRICMYKLPQRNVI